MTRTPITLLLLLLLTAIATVAQPSLEVIPASITFGCTLGGEDSVRTFVVRNTGTADVTILEYLAPAEFTAPAARDVVVPAGGEITEVLHFAPLIAGPATAGGPLIVRTAEGDVLVPLSGEIGAEPTIGVSHSRLEFYDVTVGSTRELCIAISNPSCRPIDLLDMSVDNPRFTITRRVTTPRELGPLAVDTICVTFAPTESGDEEGELVFQGTLGKRAVVRLSGRGVRSEISVEPAIVRFGGTDLGTTSAEMVVEIVNRGTQSATILPGLAITGVNAGDFSLSSAQLPFDVGPGERAPLRVRFTPGGLGARTAQIVVDNSSAIDPVVTLEGRGVLFDVIVTPDSVDMGDVFVGQSRTALDTVHVVNRGSDTVTIASTTIVGADAAAFERYGFVIVRLIPGGSYELDIEFKPFAPRVFNAELIVRLENDATFRIPLRGRGLDTASPRDRAIIGDSIHARVGERRMLRFTIDPPLGGADTARRVLVRLRLDPKALYPHRVIADGVTVTRSYSADGIVEITFSDASAVALEHFDVEVEGLFTGQPINRVTVDSADLGDPRIAVTSTPGTVGLAGCDIPPGELRRQVSIVALAPNPASTLTELYYRAAEDAEVRVMAINGTAVRYMALPASGDATLTVTIDVAGLAEGRYVVLLSDSHSLDQRMLEVLR